MARGHKSTKIPGVRLRPAPAQDSSRSDAQAARSSKRKHAGDDEADEHEDVGVEAMNTVSRPFKGAVVCFTGVQDKPALAAMAKELGAIVESNLTDTATHLVASDFASEKYKVALELGFEIVDDGWIRASHMVWRDGGEVSLEESVKGHHLPIFQGLRFSMSGFELGEKRSKLIKAIEAQGGFVSRTLDRTCTHLVTLTETSDKVSWAQSANEELTLAIVSNKTLRTVRYVEKVLAADGKATREVERERDQTDIHIVWEEWVLDCLEARGRWREEGYTIDVPHDMIKRQVVKKIVPSRTLRALDSTVGLPVENSSGVPLDSSLRKSVPSPLRWAPTEISMASSATVTTAAGDDAEPAVLKRLRRSTSSFDGSRSATVEADGHEGLMNEILGGVDLPLSQASARSKGKKRALEALDDGTADDMPNSWTASLLKRNPAASSSSTGTGSASRSKNGVASFSRSNSFSSRQPSLPKTLSAGSLHLNSLLGHVPSPIPEEAEPRSSEGSSAPRDKGSQPFAGLRFLVRCGKGRTKREVVGAVQYMGGSVLEDDTSSWGTGADYVVCKFRTGYPQPVSQLANWSTTRIVSQHWVENCYRADALLDIDSSVVHRPLQIKLPVPGASSVRLCPTKLDFNEQEFARVLIEAFGGEFVGALTRSVTHLVCAPSDINGDKYTHAVNWGIPVLDPRWLSETARTGRFPELDGFRLGASNANDSINRGPPVPPSAVDNLTTVNSNSPASLAPDLPPATDAAQMIFRESLEEPAVTSVAARTINEAASAPSAFTKAADTSLKARSTSPVKAAAPTRLGPNTARSLPAAALATTTSPEAEAPAKARSRTSDAHTPVPALRSKSDILPVSAGSATGNGKISPRPPAIAADVRAYIDQLEQEKRRASPVALAAAAGAFDDRPTKRKRVLGRQGTTVGSNGSLSTGSVTSNTTAQLSGPTSPASVAPGPPMPPSSFAPPNSPPPHSSDPIPHPGDESQPLRVNWDDPDAREAKQRMLDSLARGAAAKRGEDVACIGAEYEAEVRRVEQERESERLALALAERDKERGERRASTRRSSARA